MERKIYLVLTDTGTVFTRLIKLYTKKNYNHSSLALDSQLDEVYSFGRKNPKNPWIGGFVKENFRSDLFRQANCAIYCCTITDSQYQKIYHYIKKIENEQQHYKYNLVGLIGILLNKKIHRKNAFFCSQFVASVLKQGNISQFTKPLSLVTPYDLQKSASFQLVFTGTISQYINGTINQESKNVKLNFLRPWRLIDRFSNSA